MVTKRAKMIAGLIGWTGLVGIVAATAPYLPITERVETRTERFDSCHSGERDSPYSTGGLRVHRIVDTDVRIGEIFGVIPLPFGVLETREYDYSCETAVHHGAGEYNPVIGARQIKPDGEVINMMLEAYRYK